MIDAPGPCVLFATPGMISGGFSLEVFKRWAPYETNLVTLPGYCHILSPLDFRSYTLILLGVFSSLTSIHEYNLKEHRLYIKVEIILLYPVVI